MNRIPFYKMTEDELMEYMVTEGVIIMEASDEYKDIYFSSTNTPKSLIECEIPNMKNMRVDDLGLLEEYSISEQLMNKYREMTKNVIDKTVKVFEEIKEIKHSKRKEDQIGVIIQKTDELIDRVIHLVNGLGKEVEAINKDVFSTVKLLLMKKDASFKDYMAQGLITTSKTSRSLRVLLNNIRQIIFKKYKIEILLMDIVKIYGDILSKDVYKQLKNIVKEVQLLKKTLNTLIINLDNSTTKVNEIIKTTSDIVQATNKALMYLNKLKEYEKAMDWENSGMIRKFFMMRNMAENMFLSAFYKLPRLFYGLFSVGSFIMGLGTAQLSMDSTRNIYKDLAKNVFDEKDDKKIEEMWQNYYKKQIDMMVMDVKKNQAKKENMGLFQKTISYLTLPFKFIYRYIFKPVLSLFMGGAYPYVMKLIHKFVPSVAPYVTKMLRFIGYIASGGMLSYLGLFGLCLGITKNILSLKREESKLKLYIVENKKEIEKLIKRYGDIPEVQQLKLKYSEALKAVKKIKKEKKTVVGLAVKAYTYLTDKIRNTFGANSYLYSLMT